MLMQYGYYYRKHHSDGSAYVEAPPTRVDWRWNVVTELVQLAPGAARARLETAQDPALVDGYFYLDFENAGIAVEDELKPVKDAYHIFMNQKALRGLLEGMLICGLEHFHLSEMADISAYDVSALDIYGDLFFDVAPRLENWGWMFDTLFRTSLYEPISGRDNITKAHRMAWLLGPELFVTFYCNGKYSWSGIGRSGLSDRLQEMYYKQAFIQSFCTGAGRFNERDLKQIEFVINDIKAEAANALKGDDHADAVMAFMTEFPISVADPSLESNLELPAREIRIDEHLRIAHQATQKAGSAK